MGINLGIKSAIKSGMDNRAQAAEAHAAQVEAYAAQRTANRQANFQAIAARCPVPIIPDDLKLPGKVQLFDDEFGVASGENWGPSTQALTLTTQRLIFSRGFVSQQQEVVYLTDIRDVSFSKPLIGPGSIAVDTASGRLEGLPAIRNGQAFRDTLLAVVHFAKQQQQQGGGSYAPAPAPPVEDIPAKIAQLAQLRDLGAITPGDFETKKAELLARL